MRVYELVYTHMDVPLCVCVCACLHVCTCARGMYNAGEECVFVCVCILICVYVYVYNMFLWASRFVCILTA